MRNRPVKDPEPHLARAIDPAAPPGRGVENLETRLLDAGVPVTALREVGDVCREECIGFAASAIARLLRSLENTPAGVALQRAVLGANGRSLSQDADDSGTSKQALAVAESRVKARIEKITG